MSSPTTLHVDPEQLFAGAGPLRVYQPRLVPGLLQTEPYARAHLARQLAWQGGPTDLEDAVARRMSLWRQLTAQGRHCTILLDELVLYTRVCPEAPMINQLSQVERLAQEPNIDLGVVPSDARLPVWVCEGFCLYGTTHAVTYALTGVRHVDSPPEISAYTRAYQAMFDRAAKGPDARALIASAAEYWDLLLAEQG